MNATELLIMLVVTLGITGIGVYLFTEVVQDAQTSVDNYDPEQQTVTIIGVTGTNISNGTMKHIRVSVTSDAPIQLNETFITLSTNEETAYLNYREGLLIRDEATGFYTK